MCIYMWFVLLCSRETASSFGDMGFWFAFTETYSGPKSSERRWMALTSLASPAFWARAATNSLFWRTWSTSDVCRGLPICTHLTSTLRYLRLMFLWLRTRRRADGTNCSCLVSSLHRIGVGFRPRVSSTYNERAVFPNSATCDFGRRGFAVDNYFCCVCMTLWDKNLYRRRLFTVRSDVSYIYDVISRNLCRVA